MSVLSNSPAGPGRFDTALLHQAEKICHRELTEGQSQSHVLYVRGLLAARSGQRDFAVACLARVAAAWPCSVALFSAWGDALRQVGQSREAVNAYLRALTLDRREPEAYRRVARALSQSGCFCEARAMFEEALRLEPSHARTWVEIGETLQVEGRSTEAVPCFEAALGIDPSLGDAYRGLGQTRLAQREWQSAVACFRQGLSIHAARAELHIGLGQALLGLGAFEGAAEAFRAALVVEPQNVAACRMLVWVCELLGRPHETGEAWQSLGAALELAMEFEESATAYSQVLARKPDSFRALVKLGWCYLYAAKPREAVHSFEAAIAVQPDHRWSHIGLGQACHLTGELERGWKELGWYHRDDSRRRFEHPVWDGTPLAGKTLLVWTEQGLGDAIQLLRYVPRVAALGGQVVVECHHSMMPLVASVPGVSRVVAKDRPLPAFELQAPIADLPRIMKTGRATIPSQVPYVSVSETLRESWSSRLASKGERTVGLVWSGEPARDNARVRFTSLVSFGPLARAQGVRFISLQIGPPADELFAPPPGLEMERLLEDDCSIMDTAALICNLDLVITVDTMVAHLAGALARPVWTLLPFAADWRWHCAGDRSPWYPTMRMFRQPRQDDWRGLLEEVASALQVHDFATPTIAAEPSVSQEPR